MLRVLRGHVFPLANKVVPKPNKLSFTSIIDANRRESETTTHAYVLAIEQLQYRHERNSVIVSLHNIGATFSTMYIIYTVHVLF